MQKIIVILGPTASGKSALAVRLAQKFAGEVISADSRQVYTGLNIGTGKITKREMGGIRHHLLDVASARRQFSVEQFRLLAEKAIRQIATRGNLPIVCGGTGFYIDALVNNTHFPEVPPNLILRKKLEQKTITQLVTLLQKKDPERGATIDVHNRRRLIRALEIIAALGKVPANKKNIGAEKTNLYNPLFIGLTLPPPELKEKIVARLDARLKHGMIAEAKRLHADGLSWKRMGELGLEYRAVAEYLRGRISKTEMQIALGHQIWHYAKRQMTWFKRDTRIAWFSPTQGKAIEKTVAEFLTA